MNLEMLEKCFGSYALKKTAVYQWHERFKNGRESINDDDRSGRPSTSKADENVDKVQKMLAENHIIVNDLGLRLVAAKLVPKDLNFMQKKDRVNIAQDMLSKGETDPAFIKHIITGDETWVYEYDTQSRHQASEWRLPDEPRPKKPRRFQSKKKVMLTVFMDYNGLEKHLDGNELNLNAEKTEVMRLRNGGGREKELTGRWEGLKLE
ncbi:uncharacterized protein LOC117171005 [Belonocnema kinseyi]|uniref:uncharacterized protein LOC117171005 n=1 Tax=Belonocnema kinseyi TaxID=2817044 RepID=UPI00143DB0B1|nr:uncharacterized protein LOC117171005 [Belonocnema kinseyi]